MKKALEPLIPQDLKDIVIGATLFGGGGGGSIIEGNALIDLMEASGKPVKLPIVNLDDMEIEENGKEVTSVMVAALGSPAATKGLTFADEGRNAVSRMIIEAKNEGKILKYIYSGEQGGGNTMLPLYIAFLLDMPILNLDGNGRAVPAMDTGLQPLYHVPTSPVVLASGKGDTLVARTANPYDSRACEDIARHMCEVYDQGIGFSAWLMNKDQHSNSAVGQIMLSRDVGHLFSEYNREAILDVLRKTLDDKNFHIFVRDGIIEAIEMDTSGGFDTGYTIIRDRWTREEFRVLFQNENLVLFDSHNVALATVPGIISLIDLAPENEEYLVVPVSNAETYVGQNVALVYMDAPAPWYDNDHQGYYCWRDILVSAGYCTLNEQVTPGRTV